MDPGRRPPHFMSDPGSPRDRWGRVHNRRWPSHFVDGPGSQAGGLEDPPQGRRPPYFMSRLVLSFPECWEVREGRWRYVVTPLRVTQARPKHPEDVSKQIT